jgi:hypothetical protein
VSSSRKVAGNATGKQKGGFPPARGGSSPKLVATKPTRSRARRKTIAVADLDVSGNLTGVEAVQTGPVQWLNTMVEKVGCQVT